MIGLIAALSLGALSLDLDLGGVYGYGERHSVGVAGEIAAGFPVWNTTQADGWLRGGVLMGYQAEPYAQDNAFLGGTKATGAGHRWESWIFVEHRFRLLPTRRLHFGVGIFGGWTELFIRGGMTNSARGIRSDFSYDQGAFAMGVMVTLGYQLTDRVAVMVKALAPFPLAPGALTSYILVTAGVSFTLAAY
jgi:hypothetical protein